ncbi:MAG: D-sedoheptulose 7-phosphate isomerase [Myxococcales bacterium]|nr:D-sedoheptulose 7-phosphate isomerase [Myxococcales bacterium]MDH5307507.1 D-sedoheptulose 7-phosphate isomerase [Myxococcales bacterium]MDH5566837.1 D-sedoheptulose 7-phosphate isomerase [Myxococcales bacterium]
MSRRGVGGPDKLARVRAGIAESAAVKRATLEACEAHIVRAAELVIETFRSGGKLLAFGNGGSASDAQHFAAELAGRYRRERPGLPALALSANSSDVTAIGNDYGFERVFARLIQAHGRAGDVAVAISTSGNSANVLAAVEAAREQGMRSVGLTGRGGGKLAGMVDVPIVVPADATARIQETHITVVHLLCELVDDALFPEAPGA